MCCGMSNEIQFAIAHELAPNQGVPGPRKHEPLYAALADLVVGGPALEVNRGVSAAEGYAYRVRRDRGMEMKFRVRASRPGWSKIWRVQ
jgi:hypothetical protein